MSMHEFISDIKDMVKTKNTDVVSQKYIQPRLEACKNVTLKTRDFIVENTPKVIAAGKEGIHKIQKEVSKLSKKNGKEPPAPPSQH